MTLLLLALTLQDSQSIVIDTTSSTPISPYIYGANFPDWKNIDVKFPLARMGGNRTSAYNWETNASNAGNDWHHQNDDHMGNTEESGLAPRSFMDDAQRNGAAVILTVPTIGYVAADKNGDGDVNKTPNYLETRFHKSYPAKPGGKYTYPPDKTDRAVYQDEFVAWIDKVRSPKTPLWFSLDNEPDIWHSTHARITLTKPGYADIIANNTAYAAAIKKVAPKALTFGPANYGWQGFRRFQDAPDANNRDFLDVYLAAMKEAERKSGRRLLDVLDIHWYPEARGGGARIVEFGAKYNPATAEARIQAPRSLWDPTYVEDSWIADSLGKKPIVLLPGVQAQIAKHYPGTKLAITEYNYGGGSDASGLLAQADVLGCFGRYGIFAACNWGIGKDDVAQIAGFRAFLNYDGKGNRFGDKSLKVKGGDPAKVSVYAALDSKNKNRLTIVVINKTSTKQDYDIDTKGFTSRHVRAYTVSMKNSGGGAAPNWKDGILRTECQPHSVTTIELLR